MDAAKRKIRPEALIGVLGVAPSVAFAHDTAVEFMFMMGMAFASAVYLVFSALVIFSKQRGERRPRVIWSAVLFPVWVVTYFSLVLLKPSTFLGQSELLWIFGLPAFLVALGCVICAATLVRKFRSRRLA